MKRLAGVLAAVSAMWLAVSLVSPMPRAAAAVDTADASIPVNAARTL